MAYALGLFHDDPSVHVQTSLAESIPLVIAFDGSSHTAELVSDGVGLSHCFVLLSLSDYSIAQGVELVNPFFVFFLFFLQLNDLDLRADSLSEVVGEISISEEFAIIHLGVSNHVSHCNSPLCCFEVFPLSDYSITQGIKLVNRF